MEEVDDRYVFYYGLVAKGDGRLGRQKDAKKAYSLARMTVDHTDGRYSWHLDQAQQILNSYLYFHSIWSNYPFVFSSIVDFLYTIIHLFHLPLYYIVKNTLRVVI